MGSPRSFLLSLGSNIRPELNIREAIRRLRGYGVVNGISSVWESHAVGSGGPNFLNLCLRFEADFSDEELKRAVIGAIEGELGRSRTSDKNAPRTIDIDLIMEGERPVDLERWNHAFVILPVAELFPALRHPISGKPLSEEAAGAAASTWIRRRPDVLRGIKKGEGD